MDNFAKMFIESSLLICICILKTKIVIFEHLVHRIKVPDERHRK